VSAKTVPLSEPPLRIALSSTSPGVLARTTTSALYTKNAPGPKSWGVDESVSTPLVERKFTARRLNKGAGGAPAI
jgi:hypothetical protein